MAIRREIAQTRRETGARIREEGGVLNGYVDRLSGEPTELPAILQAVVSQQRGCDCSRGVRG